MYLESETLWRHLLSNVPAARQALRIVKYLAAQSGPSRASTIARDLDLPRSTTYHLIKVIQEEGFIVHFPEERSYGLAPLLSDIGTAYTRSHKIERLARPLAQKLVSRVRPPVVAHVGVLRGNQVVYIAKEHRLAAPSLVTQIGVSLPAHLTATGRAILSKLSTAQLTALYPSSAYLRSESIPESAALTMRKLKQLLTEARARGWAIEEEEVAAGIASVSAATLDHNGYPVAAIGLTFRLSSIGPEDWTELGSAVIASANALSMRVTGKI